MLAKSLVLEKRPFSKVHSVLSNHGFSLVGHDESVKYRLTLHDSSTESIYWLEIPVDPYQEEPELVKLKEPILYGVSDIPKPIREAAESKLFEIADYLKLNNEQMDSPSSMVQNEDEMKQLGKEMESMKTPSELDDEGMIPDPKQY